jgi:diguanylate cyclase (GGDEF)-like protein
VGLCETGCPLSASMIDGQGHEAEVYLRHKKGHRVPVSVRVCPIIDDDGAIVGSVEVFGDNSAKREAEQKVHDLEKQTFLDCLTKIPNRRYLELRLAQLLDEALRYGHEFGLMLVDVDGFKGINDQYGHAIGDEALVVAAQTLTRSLRPSDSVGRWGGDEFMAILPHVTPESLQTLAERCRNLVEQSLVTGAGGGIPLSISIGATLRQAGDNPETLLQRVDGNLYQSKRQGKNRVTVG